MASNRLYVFSLLVLFACVVVVNSAPKKPKKSAAMFQEALENTVVWLMSVRAEELALFARNEEEPPFDIKSSLKKKIARAYTLQSAPHGHKRSTTAGDGNCFIWAFMTCLGQMDDPAHPSDADRHRMLEHRRAVHQLMIRAMNPGHPLHHLASGLMQAMVGGNYPGEWMALNITEDGQSSRWASPDGPSAEQLYQSYANSLLQADTWVDWVSNNSTI
jgi:hypothetical protein